MFQFLGVATVYPIESFAHYFLTVILATSWSSNLANSEGTHCPANVSETIRYVVLRLLWYIANSPDKQLY